MSVLHQVDEDDQEPGAWYENTDGAGTFGPQQLITTLANGATSVVSSDVDGDGDLDVLSSSSIDDEIAWYENQGGQFSLVTTDVAQGSISRFRAATLPPSSFRASCRPRPRSR